MHATPLSSKLPQAAPTWSALPEAADMEDYACVMSISERPSRLRIFHRSGAQTSIPCHTLTEITLDRPDSLVIKTCCADIAEIRISGRNLQPVFDGLTEGSLVWVKESSQPTHDSGKTMISTIELERLE